VKDYFRWRQVDCHINNLYNTCFWSIVKSGKSKEEAEEQLKGTLSNQKNELLFSQFGINYNTEPQIFRKGSVILNRLVDRTVKDKRTNQEVIKKKKRDCCCA